MTIIQIQQQLIQDGELLLIGLPYKQGDIIEVTITSHLADQSKRMPLTAELLRQSGLIGLWEDRLDVQDSVSFARSLREEAQQ